MAEQRIDVKKPTHDIVLVYIICPICRLNRYSHTTTMVAVKNHARLKKLKSKPRTPKRDKLIEALERNI
jgi:hypothetical protein